MAGSDRGNILIEIHCMHIWKYHSETLNDTNICKQNGKNMTEGTGQVGSVSNGDIKANKNIQNQ
jgi:hypothetical protein